MELANILDDKTRSLHQQQLGGSIIVWIVDHFLGIGNVPAAIEALEMDSNFRVRNSCGLDDFQLVCDVKK